MSAGLQPIVLRSAEGVEMELPVAGPAPRMLAYLLDAVLVYTLIAGLVILFLMLLPAADWAAEQVERFLPELSDPTDPAFSSAVALLAALAQFVIAFHEFIYFSLWEAATRGRTPGKYIVGLRVVGDDGQPVRGLQVLIRNALRLVDSLPSAYLTGLASMLISPRGQRLGDRAAGSSVIRTDQLPRAAELSLPEGLSPLPLSRKQRELLGEREVALIRATLRRVQSTPEARADQVLKDVANALARRLALAPDEFHDPQQLLQRLLLTATRS